MYLAQLVFAIWATEAQRHAQISFSMMWPEERAESRPSQLVVANDFVRWKLRHIAKCICFHGLWKHSINTSLLKVIIKRSCWLVGPECFISSIAGAEYFIVNLQKMTCISHTNTRGYQKNRLAIECAAQRIPSATPNLQIGRRIVTNFLFFFKVLNEQIVM